ncbi:hypothetical protein ACKKBG_A15595 [Auxenochlorella protothecoides x Auxenochlorella symbiontica]
MATARARTPPTKYCKRWAGALMHSVERCLQGLRQPTSRLRLWPGMASGVPEIPKSNRASTQELPSPAAFAPGPCPAILSHCTPQLLVFYVLVAVGFGALILMWRSNIRLKALKRKVARAVREQRGRRFEPQDAARMYGMF